MDNSQDMIDKLNAELEQEPDNIAETERTADNLAEVLENLHKELKETKRQRIRDIMKHPDQEDLLTETYDEIEEELQKKISGFSNQIQMLADKRNTIIKANREAKTALDVFRDILNKEALDKNDVDLMKI